MLQGPLRGLFGGLATVFAAMLFGGLLLNRIFDPARNRLQQLDRSEYEVADQPSVRNHTASAGLCFPRYGNFA